MGKSLVTVTVLTEIPQVCCDVRFGHRHLVVRPDGIELDDERWRANVDQLEGSVVAMTGNDTRTLEMSATEVDIGFSGRAKRVLADICDHGVALAGPADYLRRRS